MKVQIANLMGRKYAGIPKNKVLQAQRSQISRVDARRQNEISIVLKTDEATIKQQIHMRCQ